MRTKRLREGGDWTIETGELRGGGDGLQGERKGMESVGEVKDGRKLERNSERV